MLDRQTQELANHDTEVGGNPAQTEAFPAAHSGKWQRVAKSYAWVDMLSSLTTIVFLAVVYVVFSFLVGNDWPFLWVVQIACAVFLVITVISAVLAFRRVRLMGYILREDDLLFRRGIMFERVVAVPYGRLQLVDIHRGPLMRAFGLSTLKFVTAAAATGVQLPGLPAAEAEKLRDELVRLAEIRRSGL